MHWRRKQGLVRFIKFLLVVFIILAFFITVGAE